MKPRIIFEDEEILVLDKPAGMTVNRAETTKNEITVQDWIENYLKVSKEGKVPNVSKAFDTSDTFATLDTFRQRAGIVHRIDKETSGILLVAKTKEAFENLQKQFKERKVKKTYLALVHGKLEGEGEIKVPVGRLPWNRKMFGVVTEGREAATKYKVIRYFEVGSGKWGINSLSSRNQDIKKSNSRISHFSLLEIQPETGRTHQIRVHLKYLGHPIFGDSLYAGRKVSRNDRKILPRVFLHASKISFTHPKTGELVGFESPLPEELDSILQILPINTNTTNNK
jgi:23S rRNA pseudouridine1911/1915/1917 synthase